MVTCLSDMRYCPEVPKKPRSIMIIGAGGIVKDSHLPAYKIAGFPVEGIYNRTAARAQALADEFGVKKVYTTIEELVEDGIKCNAVFDIALPADMTADALRKLPDHCDVLMQKPMGESIEEAREILDICREKGLNAGVNFQLCQAPYIIAVREMINSGLIGEVYDVDLRMVIKTPWNLWDFLKEKERMEVNYHSIHYIDAIRSLVGYPKGVYCKTMMDPKYPELAQSRSTIIMDYGERLRVNISTNHGHDYGPAYEESYLKLEGEKGAIRVTLGLGFDYPVGRPDKLEYVLYDGKGWREVELKGSWFPEAFIGTMGGLMKKAEDPSYYYMNSVDEAYKTMCVVEACYKSNETAMTQVDYQR